MGGGQPGNRQDNRQRGNAAQLLEKYKSMARDAQLAGDRVQTEYYLQFADHYFRVLGESRSRFEDQRRHRDDDSDEDEGDDDQMDAGDDGQAEEAREDSRERQPRRERAERAERPERGERAERPERSERAARPERGERSRRFGRDDRDGDEAGDRINGAPRESGPGNGLPFDALPPAIGRDDADEPAGQEEERPRRRTRRPRAAEGDTEAAPAA